MKNLLLAFPILLFLIACEKNPEIPVGLGNLSIKINISAINATTATINFSTSTASDLTIQEKGICWSTQANPSIQSTYLPLANESLSYQLRDLIPNTKYYIRGYFKVNGNYFYDNVISEIITNPQPASLTNGLVAYFPFNENPNDYSGNNNHLTGNGNFVSNRHNIAKAAAGFNGLSQYFSKVSPSYLPSGNSSYTISYWYKTNSTNGNMALGGFGPSGATNSANYIKTNPISGIVHYHWNMDYTLVYNFGLNTWNHLVITYDGTYENYYVNGISKATNYRGNNRYTVNPVILSVGARITTPPNSNVTEYLNGAIDEFRIYNRALSSTEVNLLYNL